MRIAAGHFKAKCLRLMDAVRESGEEVIITKRGKPVAKLTRVGRAPRKRAFGCLKGTAEVRGDIIGPVGEKWNADN